jgi:exosortase H (IPTLxxWG-CTERM-specific)
MINGPQQQGGRQPLVPKPVRRFVLRFLGLVSTYYLLTEVPWVDRRVVYPVLELSARASSWLLNLTGENTTLHGIVVQGPSFAVAVRRGCDPLEPIALLSAAIVAFPAAPKQKLSGLVIGTMLLFTQNLMRIASLYWLGKAKSPLFEPAHLEVWPAFFILTALVLWVVWSAWVQGSGKPQHA